MDDYRVITLKEFQELLRLIRGAKIISLTTITEPKLKKGAPKDIVKITRINGLINCNYENCVNNARTREGSEPDFVPEQRKWGVRLPGLPMVSWVNKDGSHNLYMEIIVKRVISVEYRQNGKLISKEEIQDYLTSSSSNKEHQQLENEVILRDYNVKNIISVDLDGHGYIIKWEEE